MVRVDRHHNPVARKKFARLTWRHYNGITFSGIGEVVSQQLPKLLSRVRIPYAAFSSLAPTHSNPLASVEYCQSLEYHQVKSQRDR
jgi:hypothetical protein